MRDGIQTYSLASANEDRRFQAIEVEELPHLSATVNVLHSFEQCSHLRDWDMGIHGIIMQFADPVRHYKATFLPDVVGGFKDPATVLAQLLQKAGVAAQLTDVADALTLTRYQSHRETSSYADWVNKQEIQG